MKFKVLKDFISSIGNFLEGKHHDIELDEPTAKMWTEHGLIEEVKDVTENTPVAVDQETAAPSEQVTAPVETAQQDAPVENTQQVESTPEPEASQEVTPAPEAVTANETK